IARVENTDDLSQGRLLVLNPMGLVDNNIFPRKLLEVRYLPQNHFVNGDANIKAFCEMLFVDQTLAFLLVTLKDQYLDIGRPLLELSLPVVQSRFGYSNKMRPRDVAYVAQISKEGDGLQGLTQTHLICQN